MIKIVVGSSSLTQPLLLYPGLGPAKAITKIFLLFLIHPVVLCSKANCRVLLMMTHGKIIW
jgi:hypothetical protein